MGLLLGFPDQIEKCWLLAREEFKFAVRRSRGKLSIIPFCCSKANIGAATNEAGAKFVLPGTHSFAGVYDRDDIINVDLQVFKMFNLPYYVNVDNIFGGGDIPWASVEMSSGEGSTFKNGKSS